MTATSASTKDGQIYAHAKIRSTVSTLGGANLTPKTLDFVGRCHIEASFVHAATTKLKNKGAHGLQSSTGTELGILASLTTPDSTEQLIATGE